MSFTALLVIVGGLFAAGIALAWATQSRNQPMFAIVAVVLFIAAEFVMGFWALPVVGAVLGLVGARRTGVVAIVTGAALVSWMVLYGWSATQGHLPSFVMSLAAAMKLKPGQLLSAATAIPALLAGPAAQLGATLRRAIQPTTPVAAAAPAPVLAPKEG